MNPKEKAAYLVVKYMSKVVSKSVAKECALVAVDEMIEIRNEIVNTLKLGALDVEVIAFLEEVKQEIKKA
jgi:hypothetical protein